MNFLDPRLSNRFWDKVSPCPISGCWLWTGSVNPAGYGQLGMGSRTDGTRRPHSAHRVSYGALVGPITDGLHIDHLCRVRCCVNPAHLEPVTNAENTRRGLAGINNAIKTCCPQGHPYSNENTFYIGESRACRLCKNQRNAEYRARQGINQ